MCASVSGGDSKVLRPTRYAGNAAIGNSGDSSPLYDFSQYADGRTLLRYKSVQHVGVRRDKDGRFWIQVVKYF